MSRRHVVKRVLRRFGETVTVRRSSGGTFDPVESTVTGETNLDVETKGIFQRFNADEVDGVEVQLEDRQLMVPVLDFAAAGLVPRAGDIVIIGDQEMRIRRTRTMETDKIYFLHLRGGRA